jgi:beta-galactosidase
VLVADHSLGVVAEVVVGVAEIGPKVTLYCRAPRCCARARTPERVLELDRLGGILALRERHELGPPEEYVEEFAG